MTMAKAMAMKARREVSRVRRSCVCVCCAVCCAVFWCFFCFFPDLIGIKIPATASRRTALGLTKHTGKRAANANRATCSETPCG